MNIGRKTSCTDEKIIKIQILVLNLVVYVKEPISCDQVKVRAGTKIVNIPYSLNPVPEQ